MRGSITGTILGALGVLIAVGASILLHRYSQVRREAYARLGRVDRRIISTELGDIEVALRGDGEPVLIVHGAAGGVDQALDLAGDVPAGHRIIAPSRFGYLGSPMPTMATPASQASIFVSMLDELGIEKTVVMAYSAGGPSAVQLAIQYPERVSGLILVSTAMSEKPLTLPPKPVIAALTKSDFAFWVLSHPLRSFSQRMFVPAGFSPSESAQEQIDKTMAGLLPIRPRGRGLLHDMYVTNRDAHLRSQQYDFESISVPVMVINAKDDPSANFEDARRMSSRIPESEFLEVESGGHMLLDNQARVQEHINEFFAKVED